MSISYIFIRTPGIIKNQYQKNLSRKRLITKSEKKVKQEDLQRLKTAQSNTISVIMCLNLNVI